MLSFWASRDHRPGSEPDLLKKPRPSFKKSLHDRLLMASHGFRLGSHGLPTELGRREDLPHSHCICLSYSTGIDGDEQHLLCMCPVVQNVRRQFLQMCHGPRSIAQLLQLKKFSCRHAVPLDTCGHDHVAARCGPCRFLCLSGGWSLHDF